MLHQWVATFLQHNALAQMYIESSTWRMFNLRGKDHAKNFEIGIPKDSGYATNNYSSYCIYWRIGTLSTEPMSSRDYSGLLLYRLPSRKGKKGANEHGRKICYAYGPTA